MGGNNNNKIVHTKTKERRNNEPKQITVAVSPLFAVNRHPSLLLLFRRAHSHLTLVTFYRQFYRNAKKTRKIASK